MYEINVTVTITLNTKWYYDILNGIYLIPR